MPPLAAMPITHESFPKSTPITDIFVGASYREVKKSRLLQGKT